jgi:hypothetical protein
MPHLGPRPFLPCFTEIMNIFAFEKLDKSIWGNFHPALNLGTLPISFLSSCVSTAVPLGVGSALVEPPES